MILYKSRSIITKKISLSKLTYEMYRYHRISLRNKEKKLVWERSGQKGKEKIWERELQRDPHKIGRLGNCMLLINFLTETNSVMAISKL